MVSPAEMDPHIIVESMTVENVGEGVTPPRSTTQESVAGLLEEEQVQAMETEPPVSPVFPNEDDLLSGAAAASVEAGMASLQVFLLEGQGGDEEASV